MTTVDMLEESIREAHKRGWQGQYSATYSGLREYAELLIEQHTFPMLIFNHGFVKPLWGEEMVFDNYIFNAKEVAFYQSKIVNWAHHLQRMVISTDPIKYLWENIFDV